MLEKLKIGMRLMPAENWVDEAYKVYEHGNGLARSTIRLMESGAVYYRGQWEGTRKDIKMIYVAGDMSAGAHSLPASCFKPMTTKHKFNE